ncbi:MAG: hypothetical protein RLZZ383_1270 [Pseudomonadota bacterium]|jgi:alpha-D-ribose 1-methylphosphonate 5-triphosphate synthase subunit PhnH
MTAARGAIGAVVVLALLHQDVWWWADPTLVAGAVPIGLAWHVGYALAAAALWAAVGRWAWPSSPWAEGSSS